MMAERPQSTAAGSALSRWAVVAICALLLIVAILRDRGSVSDAGANALSLLVILAGVAWALATANRLRRLCELYLWLAFIVSLSLLKIFTDRVAQRLEIDELTAFQAAAVAHVLVAVAALWGLGAWSRKTRQVDAHAYGIRLAAGLLIFGAVVFWIGARTFPGSSLEAVSASLGGHMWTAANFLAAIFITRVGLGLLTRALWEAGDRAFSLLGLATIAFGAVFWILYLAFRLTVMREAAAEYGRTGAVPPWFSPWSDWSGLLFGLSAYWPTWV